MSNLALFMKSNKKEREEVEFVATQALCDAKGTPLKWKLKPLTTSESERIREECVREVPIKGKPNMYRPVMDTRKYLSKLVACSVVEPNLSSAELQDSYGVKTPEALVQAMVDDPGEYQILVNYVQEFNGLNKTLQEEVTEAKNS